MQLGDVLKKDDSQGVSWTTADSASRYRHLRQFSINLRVICNGVRTTRRNIVSFLVCNLYRLIISSPCQLSFRQLDCKPFFICRWYCYLCPLCQSLQELLDVCSNFADTHRVVFNVSKSQCLIVHFLGWYTVTQPVFRLCSFALPYTDNYVYLGHVINPRLTDDADIMRQTRLLYARANGV